MKKYLTAPIMAQASSLVQDAESQESLNQTQSQVELIQSFQNLRSLPFGADFVQISKEARRLGITPSGYKQQYQAWVRGQQCK